jgi:glycerophosphoryl diester phosphodiesterase
MGARGGDRKGGSGLTSLDRSGGVARDPVRNPENCRGYAEEDLSSSELDGLHVITWTFDVAGLVPRLCHTRPAVPYLDTGQIGFAHRGGAALWPENTLHAFQGAIDLGIRYIETDLHLTRDGVVVCIHDARVDRTTDGVGLVRDLDLAELRALDAGYRFTPDGQSFPFRGKGHRVPMLVELLDLGAYVNAEIKQREPAMEQAVWRVIAEHDVRDRVLIAAAHDPLGERFRAVRRSHVPTSAGIRGVLRFMLGVRSRWHARYAFEALQIPETYRGIRVLDRALIRDAHERGIAVHVWTIDDEAKMHALYDLGVDGVMTDRPDVLTRVMRERGLL